MLVIVNPYATTMSDRLKHLVVYALQGRYDVTAVDTQRKGHATELCREAAREGYDVVVAFGGDGTVNEAANGLVGSATPLTCLPGGATNVFCKMLGIPNDIVDATEHLLGLADRWEPRAVDLGRVNGRAFTFAAGMGLDASVVERVDRNPAHEGALGRLVLHRSRRWHVPAPLRRAPAAARRRRSTAASAIAASARSSRTASRTRTSRRARSTCRGRAAGLGRPRRRRAHAREPGRRADRACRALSSRARCPTTAGSRRSRAPTRSSCAPPTAARCPCRSTATTWPTTTRSASPSSPGALRCDRLTGPGTLEVANPGR